MNLENTPDNFNLKLSDTDWAKKYIRDSFEKLSFSLSDLQIEFFLTYYRLLVEKNRVMNLTAITKFEDVVQKHFIDSALVCKSDCEQLHLNPFTGRLIDVGSGAGFPGIPLKILFPELEVVLLDSLNKRVLFLNEVIHTLGLTGITAVHGRAEEAAFDSSYREGFDYCVSRAVASLSSLSEYCLPFVKRGGIFIAYKSAGIDQECQEAKKAVFLLGGDTESVKTAKIPDTDIERLFVFIRKNRGTPAKYPRKAGTPTKNPLS
ncbi:MAG: 16S rRNA (guanine(527)-N(7))-methyltransferase RsmG [Lachnospiraceae bacterium]|nr:16S rRNA (guanine(527)-N(7))-methyltransferase RsmG [Lachnospiraceae bacterium]